MSQNDGRNRGTYIISGVMVAMSFMAMIIPLAMYHVAQIAAVVGRSRAFLLLGGVISLLFALSVLTGEGLFALSALNGALWLVPFVVGVVLRESLGPRSLAFSALVMAALPLVGLGLIILFPITDLVSAMREENIRAAFEPLVSSGGQVDLDEILKSAQAVQESAEFSTLAAVLAADWKMRVMWLVYGTGNPLLFGFFVVSFGNLLLLDMAFEQVEKIRALVAYFDRNSVGSAFTANGNRDGSLDNLKASIGQGRSDVFQVDRVSQMSANSSGEQTFLHRFLRRMVRPAEKVGELSMLGQSFRLKPREQSSWSLRRFQFPLLPSLVGAIGLLALGTSYPVLSEQGAPVLGGTPGTVGAWVAICALLCFFGSSCLAAQGVIVALQRLTPLALLILLLLFLFSGGFVVANPLMMIAIFGTVGLLDHLYDLRSLKSGSPERST